MFSCFEDDFALVCCGVWLKKYVRLPWCYPEENHRCKLWRAQLAFHCQDWRCVKAFQGPGNSQGNYLTTTHHKCELLISPKNMLNILMKATQHPQEAAVKTRLFTHRQHSDGLLQLQWDRLLDERERTVLLVRCLATCRNAESTDADQRFGHTFVWQYVGESKFRL